MPSEIEDLIGWTTDPDELDYDEEWAADDSAGQVMAREHSIPRASPIMFRTSDSTIMFEAGGKFYCWNRIDWGVWEILFVTSLEEIIATIRTQGNKGLKMKEL